MEQRLRRGRPDYSDGRGELHQGLVRRPDGAAASAVAHQLQVQRQADDTGDEEHLALAQGG
ncbi:MAG: hypothetical protein EBU90_31615 [Proteobacteria bacterium]|nr:hypothetical protein [Pseudomonadota bacterium]